MKVYTVCIEMPDDFEPCSVGCENECPFSSWSEYDCENYCYLKYYDKGKFSCIMIDTKLNMCD